MGLAGQSPVILNRRIDHKLIYRTLPLLGFGYHFNSMTSSSNELNLAFQTIFRGALKPTIMAMLQSFIPPLRVIVSCGGSTEIVFLIDNDLHCPPQTDTENATR